jgi:RimJ/RimL family protein N-acetyltransferase
VPDISLRPYRSEDASALHAAALESVADVFPWLPFCHPEYSIEEAREWIDSRAALFQNGLEYSFAIVDGTDRYLGGCGLNMINPLHRFANLGYWVRTSEMGRRVAPAAIREVARFAFTRTDLVRLEIVCAVGNTRSQRAAEHAGAAREGVLRDRLFLRDRPVDAVMYSIVRSEWMQPARPQAC